MGVFKSVLRTNYLVRLTECTSKAFDLASEGLRICDDWTMK